MKSNFKNATKIVPLVIGLSLIVGLTIWSVFAINKGEVIPFSSIEKVIQAQSGDVVTLKETADGTIYIKTPEGKYVSHFRPNSPKVEELVEKYNVQYKYSTGSQAGNWIFGGLLIVLLGAGLLIQRKGGFAGAKMKHGTAKPMPLPSVTLNDIGGLPEEMKDEIHQTLAIVKEPERSKKLGIKPPKGILLYGPPGTGKTLLAQAMAHELGASFFTASGSAFTELFVGVGASRIRGLFENARKSTPAVIFIDEVDALAGKRKQHGGEEAEKTLTELLVQLDGGHTNEGILFIAATNRKDMLDDAFLRPGRIDFSFQVPLPDMKGRKEIIDIHTKGKQLSEEVVASLDLLADSTSGFSGAEISSLFESASRKAVREGRELVGMADLDYAIDRTILGSTSRALNDPDTKRRVAIHEAGHALIQALTKPNTVRKATIIPRGQALGYVAPIQKEMHLSTTSELLDQVSMILAGGVAERLYLGEHSIGVSGDVQQAKKLLEDMVETGMLEDGFTLTFDKQDKDAKMQELYGKALEKTELMLKAHKNEYECLVDVLLKKETLDGEEVQAIVTGKNLEVSYV
ncbi:cell division protease FtsH [Lederbergia galactosidilyticus]|uniref:AAA family ATPase n=1 Tax=Lederbergia galactosidilytica TaxID=217031 RepID=UPI001AE23D7F|nr:AAA family ATPase [Lederbergia galactosidilytica]MBP1916195.1 cell division protease FtsH [Lederbergia galactosidilytica]